MSLCVVGNWTILAGALLVNRDDARLFRDWPTAAPVQLMFIFWLWNGASIFWSYAPDLAWTEFNRTGGYLAIMMLGVLVGGQRLPRSLVSPLFLAVTVTASAYGLGAKLFPAQIINTDALARISVPMGYTNAMGLMAALGVPLALHLAADASSRWYLRLPAASSLPVLLITLFFTVSRGAVLALVVGLLVYLAIAPARLRTSGLLAISLAPSTLVSWWGNGQEALMKDKVELALRLEAAGPLRLYLALSVVATALLFLAALFIGSRISFSPRLTRAVGAAVVVVAVIAIVVPSTQFLASKPSISQWVRESHAEFTVGKTSKLGAARFLQFGSQGRFRLWQEAMDNWSDSRLTGTGAQSFPLVHLQRQAFDSPFVKQPHGLPFRLLTELGIVGFLLGYLFIAAVSLTAMFLVCALRLRWDRLSASAMFTAMVVYLVHTGYDWDWNMYALTSVYFLFAGVCAGWYASVRRQR
ncbi:MAG: O-antigen ligase family protein [Thermoleophilia bacterium]